MSTERIDLVITDPDGTRIAMLIKLIHPEIPILVLSSLTETPHGTAIFGLV